MQTDARIFKQLKKKCSFLLDKLCKFAKNSNNTLVRRSLIKKLLYFSMKHKKRCVRITHLELCDDRLCAAFCEKYQKAADEPPLRASSHESPLLIV